LHLWFYLQAAVSGRVVVFVVAGDPARAPICAIDTTRNWS